MSIFERQAHESINLIREGVNQTGQGLQEIRDGAYGRGAMDFTAGAAKTLVTTNAAAGIIAARALVAPEEVAREFQGILPHVSICHDGTPLRMEHTERVK